AGYHSPLTQNSTLRSRISATVCVVLRSTMSAPDSEVRLVGHRRSTRSPGALWQDGAVHDEFRPGFGRGLTVVMAVAAVAAFGFVAATEGATDALLTLPWLCLFVTCCWAIFWRPCVVVSDAGVRLVNVTRTID